ncbi:MAG: hypothetical protein ACRDJJ_09635 [Actinomycetota bacterium]
MGAAHDGVLGDDRGDRGDVVAAAVADNFDAPRAWLIVGAVATGYIVSRGLAKAGNAHDHGDDGSRGY